MSRFASVDLAAHRLPDALTLRSYPVMIGLLALAAVGGAGIHRFVLAVLGMTGSLALYLLLAVLPGSAMGLGDVKLSGLMGLALGWLGALPLLAGILLGSLLAGVVGVTLLAAGRISWRTRVPFGPFMLAGAFTVILHRHGRTGAAANHPPDPALRKRLAPPLRGVRRRVGQTRPFRQPVTTVTLQPWSWREDPGLANGCCCATGCHASRLGRGSPCGAG